MSADPLIELRDVSFSYSPGAGVLDRLSVSVPEGSITGVVGPSGCGKTTLLAILAGLRAPSAGEVTRRGSERLAGHHPLSMVFQKDTLLPWLTTAENVGLYFRLNSARTARTAGTDKVAAAQRVAHLIKLAGLEGAERKYPYQLSGGMRRRTAFLAAVAPQPQVLLLDEPFSSLDEPTRVGIHQSIYEIVRELGITVILVTHDLAEAISLCDEVLILTNRPARVCQRHTMPFGVQRNMYDLRRTPEFLRFYGLLWEELSRQIRAAVGHGPDGGG